MNKYTDLLAIMLEKSMDTSGEKSIYSAVKIFQNLLNPTWNISFVHIVHEVTVGGKYDILTSCFISNTDDSDFFSSV